MTLFRHKKDGYLYTISLRTPMMFTGRWYEAKPYFPGQGQLKRFAKLDDFTAVSHSGRIS